MSRLARTTRTELLVAFVMTALLCAPVRAAQPIYEEEPYDKITLDRANDNAVLKIVPLNLPNRQPPARKPVGKLVVHLLESPDKEYELSWRSIDKLELFEQLILDEAAALVAKGKYDQAFDYYVYLERNKPYTPGLKKAVDEYLYEEAKWAQRRGQGDSALALLRELRNRDPRRPGIESALGRVTDELVGRCVQAKNFAAARTYLKNLAANYPENAVVAQWRERLNRQAAPLLAEARAAAGAGNLSQAADLTRQLAAVWPDLPGARDWAKEMHKKYPRVVVGVRTLAADVAPNRLDDWTIRRDCRLLYRTLAEFIGAGAEGGKYLCPFGEISSESLGRRVAMKLKPDIGWAEGDATLTSFDVSQRLLALANTADPGYRVDWADLMMSVSLRGVYGLDVDLRRPHVRPEAMLQIALTPHGKPLKPGEPPPVNGPFGVLSRSADEVIFTANRRYFAAEPGQPREIVERRYPTVAKAIAALKRGEILAVDRVNPWNLAALRADSHLIVQPYGAPLVHCLVPNPRRPLMSDRTFRRALAYGINRDVILGQMLGGTDKEPVEVPGCVVTSSPFPMGIDAGDPMGYASDESIKPRPYEPRMTIALANVAFKGYLDSKKPKTPKDSKDSKDAKPAETPAPKPAAEGQDGEAPNGEAKPAPKPAAKPKVILPTLVLAYPASDEIASAACASIQKQFKLVDVPIELRAIEGPMPTRIPDDVDLMYVELPTWEPLVDARRVLGENGIAGQCSPYMTQALRQLDEAVDWTQARECLHRIHRIAVNDVSILPLWQLVDYFVCHESLRGVAARPVSLYQNVEQWRLPFQYPAEQ